MLPLPWKTIAVRYPSCAIGIFCTGRMRYRPVTGALAANGAVADLPPPIRMHRQSGQNIEVSCIAKGKAKTPYEFCVKVGIATKARQNLIVGARSFPNNPFDCHTLAEQIEQAAILIQAVAVVPETVYVDRGYRLKKEDRLHTQTCCPICSGR